MGIGKSRKSSIVDDMFSNVDKKEEVQNVTTDIDEYLRKIESINNILAEQHNRLSRGWKSEQEIANALSAAADSCENIVSGICKAIVDAQQNTVFETKVKPEHLTKLNEIVNQAIKQEEELLEKHRAAQVEIFEKHERKIEKMLSHGEGFWFSYLWAKVFYITFLVTIILAILYVKFAK